MTESTGFTMALGGSCARRGRSKRVTEGSIVSDDAHVPAAFGRAGFGFSRSP